MYVPLEHLSVRLREIRSKEVKSGKAIVEAVFTLGSYILHVIRTQCGPSEAVVYYFRYLTAPRLPACLSSAPFVLLRRNPDVCMYIYPHGKNMRAFFDESLRSLCAVNVYSVSRK